MAGAEVKRRTTRRKQRGTTTSTSNNKSDDDNDTAQTVDANDRPLDLPALREARLAYLSQPPEVKRTGMKYEYVKRTRTLVHVDDGEDRTQRRRPSPREPSPPPLQSEPPRRSRRTARPKENVYHHAASDAAVDDHVYTRVERRSPRAPVPSRSHTRTAKTRENLDAPIIDVPPPTRRRHTEPTRRRESHSDQDEPVITPDAPLIEPAVRPSVNRSATTGKPRMEPPSPRQSRSSLPPRSTPGLFGALLLPKPSQKKTSCLTCGADDIPITESARLPCSHRMCHACLRRIFILSVKDPAHMPPRCCTAQHIDLKHVDKLFDQKFKVLWNRKLAEYHTKNRIYCPTRRCGAWIKPHHITIERGRKVARCKQCKTRVCPTCSQKMHTSRECPKDPETNALVEEAKKQGWQRCYRCQAMVELKEGCNHMTCRCTAEFCMVCGAKWKSCDCPWFPYEAVDAHLGNPVRYQEEMDRRRDQIHRDEILARRMQQMGLQNAPNDNGFGQGNAAGHHMDQNFVQLAREALTANYAQGAQAARELLNGIMTGRENRLPGMPAQLEQMLGILRQGHMPDPAEESPEEMLARRPGRRGTVRRRRPAVDDDAESHRRARDEEQERRIQDWANRVI